MFDPITLGALAAGAQAIGGGLQSLFSGNKKRERELNDYAKNSPIYQPSKSINDYYQQALNRYNENAYQSALYKAGEKNIQRGTASALNALQGRGAAIAGAGRVALGQNTALTNLGAQAEAQKNAKFGQLGQAAQAKTAEEYKAFDINQMTPYNRQLQLKQMAAQAANDRFSSGLSMAAGGIGHLAQLGIAKQMYGNKPIPDNIDTSAANLTAINNFKTPVFNWSTKSWDY
jgi:hypothetical protein